MSTPTDAPSHCVDAVVSDAADGVRADGHMPDIQAIRGYVQGVVERMERKDSEKPHSYGSVAKKKAKLSTGRAAPALVREAEKRLARKGLPGLMDPDGWEIQRRPITMAEMAKSTTAFGDHASRCLTRRIRLLKSKPEYRAKLETINPLAMRGELGSDKKKHAESLWWDVIKASEVHFGPWWKPPPERLWFS